MPFKPGIDFNNFGHRFNLDEPDGLKKLTDAMVEHMNDMAYKLNQTMRNLEETSFGSESVTILNRGSSASSPGSSVDLSSILARLTAIGSGRMPGKSGFRSLFISISLVLPPPSSLSR